VKLCIDSRETKKISRFREYLQNKKSTIIDGIKVELYDVSDAHTEDMLVGIERKAKDFVTSIFDERLDKQLKELCENFTYPFLFIEYDGIKDMILDNPNVNPRIILGKLASIMARHRVTVLFTGNYNNVPFYVPMVIRTIEKFYDGKTEIKHYTPIRGKPSKRKPSVQEVKLDLISRIPGIGLQRAVKLLEKFNWSITDISTASTESIMEVPGIGKKLASHIKEVLS